MHKTHFRAARGGNFLPGSLVCFLCGCKKAIHFTFCTVKELPMQDACCEEAHLLLQQLPSDASADVQYQGDVLPEDSCIRRLHVSRQKRHQPK